MSPIKRILSLAVVAVVSISYARADEMTLVKSADATTRRYQGRALDIIGIGPGMGIDEVRKILTTEYGAAPQEDKTSLGISYNSIDENSTPYVGRMIASKQNDSMTVYFSSPAIGNIVIAATRRVDFIDVLTAPDIDTVFDSLHAKYGPSSYSHYANMNGYLSVDQWLYNATAQQPCPKPFCYGPPMVSSPEYISLYKSRIATGEYFSSSAEVYRFAGDKSRITYLITKFDDLQNEVASMEEAIKQLQKTAMTTYASRAKAQLPPKL